MKEIVIFQRIVPHYRVPLFQMMHASLKRVGMRLVVVYGQEYPGTVPRSVVVDEEWARFSKNFYFGFGGVQMVWQKMPFFQLLRGELVVVEQANRLLINYVLMALNRLGLIKLAFWGHGKNCQSLAPDGLVERFKAWYSTSVDWWFAYTEDSSQRLRGLGYDPNRVTVLNNSIDTKALLIAYQNMSVVERQCVRDSLNVNTENVAVYCGGIYSEKKIDFMLAAAQKIRSKVIDFELLVIGEGPEQHKIERFAAANRWVHYVGAVTGTERAKYFSIAKVCLMPGLVGLAVLDSFVFQTPMVTTDLPIHSPEFAYINNDENGIVTVFDAVVYAESVASLLVDPDKLDTLRRGCERASGLYTIESMAKNFVDGIALFCAGKAR